MFFDINLLALACQVLEHWVDTVTGDAVKSVISMQSLCYSISALLLT